MNIDIRQLLRNCPDALKEFEVLPNKTDAWFDLAFGATPSLFVEYDRNDPKVERIRLFDEQKTREWLQIDERRSEEAGFRYGALAGGEK